MKEKNVATFKTTHNRDYPEYDIKSGNAARIEAQETGKNVR